MADKKMSPIVVSCLLSILSMGVYSLWDYAHKFEATIGALEVKGAQTVAQSKIEGGEKASSLAVLYPLSVESKAQAEKLAHTPDESARLIDGTFIRTPSAATVAAEAVAASAPLNAVLQPTTVALDYFAMLKQAVVVDAVMGNGAVVSGKFYSVGEAVETFAYPAKNGSAMVAPVLAKVTARAIVLKEPAGQGSRTLTVNAENP